MGLATLGGIPMHVDPDSVSWTFDMKIVEHKTMGGKVIQVFGTEMGDMTVSGKFGNADRRKGEDAAWEAQERMFAQVKAWSKGDAATFKPVPLRFLYPSKKWDFKVFIKAFAADSGYFEYNNTNTNPGWRMTLFVVHDATGVVVKGIADIYLSRLMNGVGWHQTKYNGPNEDDVTKLLKGAGVDDIYHYLADPVINNTAGAAGAPPSDSPTATPPHVATGPGGTGGVTP